jgi:cation transport ATPase
MLYTGHGLGLALNLSGRDSLATCPCLDRIVVGDTGRVLERGWQSVVSWNLNMFTLIGLGVSVAYIYSLIAAIFPELFPASFRGKEGTVSTGKGASMGVLSRNAEAIEVMRKIDTLVMDKTGTLTEGKPKVVAVSTVAGGDETDMLRLAASLEKGSEYPLAAAIVNGAAENRPGRNRRF